MILLHQPDDIIFPICPCRQHIEKASQEFVDRFLWFERAASQPTRASTLSSPWLSNYVDELALENVHDIMS